VVELAVASQLRHRKNIYELKSRQNSVSTRIKMAADLPASQFIDFIVFLPPQVDIQMEGQDIEKTCVALKVAPATSWLLASCRINFPEGRIA
jgi:hypothetical protein